MATLWLALHRRMSRLNIRTTAQNVLVLGYFTTIRGAEAVIEDRRGEPGYRNYPDGFEIHELLLNETLENPVRLS